MAFLLAKRFPRRGSTTIQAFFGEGIRRCSSLSTQPTCGIPEQLLAKHSMGPWLMFADSDNDNADRETPLRRCYSFAYDRVFDITGAYNNQGRRCWGSQYGWLLTLGGDSNMHLYNPVTGSIRYLPSQRTFELRDSDKDEDVLTSFIKTFALSSDPADGSAVVVAIHGGSRLLAYASPGDRAWQSVRFRSTAVANHDVIFHKGNFYAINCLGRLSIIDTTVTEPKEKRIATFRPCREGENFYLVDVSGDLHLIVKQYHYGEDDYRTTGFDAYKFDSKFVTNKAKWIGVHNFNGHAVFVGNNSTFAVSSDFPEIKPDCIYFSDDFSEVYDRGHCDMGLYDYANKTLLEPFYKSKDSLSKFSRPFYFLPCR